MNKPLSPFEITMLVCFGVSWPFSILKSLSTKVVAGKSPVFMTIVAVGYAFGLAHKYFYSRDWVALLYAFNLILVLIDLCLYFHYRHPLDIQDI